MADWKKIKADYLRNDTSYRKLASKYGVSLSSIARKAKEEKWADMRTQTEHKLNTKIVDSVVNQEAKKVDRIQSVADLLLQKIEERVADGSLLIESKDFRAITASIKDLREIKGYKSELDMQEQLARIEKLKKEAQKDVVDESNNNYGVFIMPAIMEMPDE